MAWKDRRRDVDQYSWGQFKPIELKINHPDLVAFILGQRAGDVVGKVGYRKILDASPVELGILAKFALSVKALKEASPKAYTSK